MKTGEMKQIYYYARFLILLSVFTHSFAQKTLEQQVSLPLRKSTGEPMATLININNISMWVKADGSSVLKSYPSVRDPNRLCRWSVIYPRGAKGVIYQDGILWGGLVHDGKVVHFDRPSLLRVGGVRYSSGLQPGRIEMKGVAENPDDPDVRIWRIRRDWQKADLSRDAAEFYHVSVDSVTQEQIDEIRHQYEVDWNEWPWHKGAPFYDINNNIIMDDGEEPGLAYGDQVVWFAANDLNFALAERKWGSPPIGLEMQVTLWAYNRIDTRLDEVITRRNEALQHIIFKRVRLIYKGCSDTPDTARIDSMYIGQWSDPDLGQAGDDLVGCDTLLNMGFGYNSIGDDIEYRYLGCSTPAIGYVILRGSVIPSSGDHAFFDMKINNDHKNLPMTAFIYFHPLSAYEDIWSGYIGAMTAYQAMRGYNPYIRWTNVYYLHPPGITPGPFPYAGDPVQGTGHIDGLKVDYSWNSGDRKFICSSGPFGMALGDTQEVIIALVGGMGSDRLASISVMKHHARWAHTLAMGNYELGFKEDPIPVMEPVPGHYFLYHNYPNPFNAGTEIRYDLPVQRHVKLTIYNLLGQMVKVLIDKNQEAKSYKIRWDGTDSRGEKVPTGLYLYRIEAGSMILMKKMLLAE